MFSEKLGGLKQRIVAQNSPGLGELPGRLGDTDIIGPSTPPPISSGGKRRFFDGACTEMQEACCVLSWTSRAG